MPEEMETNMRVPKSAGKRGPEDSKSDVEFACRLAQPDIPQFE